MKNSHLLLLLMILSGFACNAQGLYSNENLEQSSDEELNVYLKNAEKQKKNGFIFAAAGGGAVIGTIIYATSMDDAYGGVAIALLGTIAGTTFTGIGIGKVISNSSKIRRINKIKDSRAPLVVMNLTPNFSYDKFLGTSSTGMRLSIVF